LPESKNFSQITQRLEKIHIMTGKKNYCFLYEKKTCSINIGSQKYDIYHHNLFVLITFTKIRLRSEFNVFRDFLGKADI